MDITFDFYEVFQITSTTLSPETVRPRKNGRIVDETVMDAKMKC